MLAVVKRNHRDHAILSTLIDCGLRANEVCQIKVDDLYFHQLLIHVKQGKGRKDRVVPMSAQAARVLTKHIAKRDNDSPYLFSTVKSEQFSPNSLLQLVRRVAKAADVENPTVHRFRHCFALSWLRNGGDVMTLQRVMGHADLATTRVYLALTTEDLQRSHQSASPLAHLLRCK
jgi:site-specific recombinase XerD